MTWCRPSFDAPKRVSRDTLVAAMHRVGESTYTRYVVCVLQSYCDVDGHVKTPDRERIRGEFEAKVYKGARLERPVSFFLNEKLLLTKSRTKDDD